MKNPGLSPEAAQAQAISSQLQQLYWARWENSDTVTPPYLADAERIVDIRLAKVYRAAEPIGWGALLATNTELFPQLEVQEK